MPLSSDLINSLDEALKLELKLHPAANLIDIYKLIYQALYGPSHIISDHATLCRSIETELSQMEGDYNPPMQNLGVYSRISLSVLHIPGVMLSEAISKLAEWLLASKADVDETSIISFWHDLKPLIEKHITASQGEWDEVHSLVSSGSIPSHSTLYKSLYHPHYRLINHSLNAYMDYFKV